MARTFFYGVIGGITLLSCGCSSIMTHSGPYDGYYPGVRNNADRISEGEMGWGMTTLLLLDMPFSAVVDTILLPYDMYRSDKDQRPASPKERLASKEKEEREAKSKEVENNQTASTQ